MKKQNKKCYIITYAEANNISYDLSYEVFETENDAVKRMEEFMNNKFKEYEYSEDEIEEIKENSTWDYCEDDEGEWYVRIDETILYEEDEDSVSKESLKVEMARVAQPDPLEDVDDLPTTVIVNIDEIGYNAEDGDNLYECITNYLSDIYGYCIYGYNTEDLDTITGNIIVTNIEWDTKE